MKKGGFTLVEIMIVVAIIGLLAVLAIPNFIKARAKTLANQCVNNLRLIQSAKDQYSFENAITSTVIPAEADIEVYLKNSVIPSEPTGSSYSINAINTNAMCNSGLKGHTL
ncbi:MAG: prepilin-type N-terminal cleavage/methylation domain-containing protein [Candidatus Tritonobacter lacicola]|nr:prepilin-type N-terminal cleavage/methylation domain-containing protein [Candidatus Tritonobacter lacicola]